MLIDDILEVDESGCLFSNNNPCNYDWRVLDSIRGDYLEMLVVDDTEL